MKIELTREGLLVYLADYYTTQDALTLVEVVIVDSIWNIVIYNLYPCQLRSCLRLMLP